MVSSKQVLSELNALGNPKNVEGMHRFGISGRTMYGVTVTDMRKMAKRIGTDHNLADTLWETGVHEARILATMLEDPVKVTDEQIGRWVLDIDSWDLCDQLCGNLLLNIDFARKKIEEWISSEPEFVRRVGFVMIVGITINDKAASNDLFLHYLKVIENSVPDERNFVKKAVSWAIRQIGKRNMSLNTLAVETAQRLKKTGIKSNRWIASDVIRELTDLSVLDRIRKKEG